MGNYVEELLDYLSLYQSIIRQGYIGQEYLEEINKLNSEIDELQKVVRMGGDCSSFNFGTLKKDIAKLFHPDVFKPPHDILENPDELLGKTFGVMKQIDDYKKRSNKSSFNYNTATGSGSKNDFNSSTRQTNYQRNNDYNSEYDAQPNQTYEDDWDGFQQQPNSFKEDNNEIDIIQIFADKFNSIFRGIPSDSNDYEKIMGRYKRTEQSLLEKIKFLETCINSLKREEMSLNVEKMNATKEEVIDGCYNNRLEQLYRIALEASRSKEQMQKERTQRSIELEPNIQKLFEKWQIDANVYIEKYNSLLQKYFDYRRNLSNIDYESMEEQLQNMQEYINEHYTDYNKAFNGIRRAVLAQDPKYQELAKRSKEAIEKFKDADLNYQNFVSNPIPHKRKIKEQIEKGYNEELDSIKFEISSKKRKKEKLEKKLSKVRDKKGHLVEEYGNIYGSSNRRM